MGCLKEVLRKVKKVRCTAGGFCCSWSPISPLPKSKGLGARIINFPIKRSDPDNPTHKSRQIKCVRALHQQQHKKNNLRQHHIDRPSVITDCQRLSSSLQQVKTRQSQRCLLHLIKSLRMFSSAPTSLWELSSRKLRWFSFMNTLHQRDHEMSRSHPWNR